MILTRGGIQTKMENTNRFLLILFLEINTYNYTRLPMIWWLWFRQLGTYIKGKRVVDLVHSKDYKYLRIKG